MNNLRKLYVGMLTSAVAVSVFTPIAKVSADDEYILTFTNNPSNQTVHTMQNENGNLKIDGQYVELRNSNDQRIGTANCNGDNSVCTITVSDGTKGRLNYNGNQTFSLYMQGHEIGDHEFQFDEGISIEDYIEPGPGPGPNDPRFDGKAYIIWSCGSGICYKYYDNIPDFNDGNSYFIKDTTIEADNNSGQKFNVKAKYKYWASKEGFDNWVNAYKTYKGITGDIDWTKVNPADMIGEPVDIRQYEREAEESGACTKEGKVQEEFEACVNEYAASKGVWTARAQLQPVGEPTDNNAYVSYGDRNFKIVIYNSEFKGITIGNLDDLHYYFNEWSNPFLRQDQYDISGTTEKKPTYITTVLFEKTVNIKTLDYNGFEITKIEALDVPSNAVEIKKVDGEWKITFSSSFYDNVVFKATDRNGEVSYFAIKRTTVDAWIPWIDNKPVYNADFYYEDTKSYTDFKLTARLVFKDGTTKDVILTASKGIDDGLGNIDHEHYEVNGGKGLKKASFRYELTEKEARNIKKAYTNVELKGSTSTKFAGTYAGSGKGVLANIYDPEEDV